MLVKFYIEKEKMSVYCVHFIDVCTILDMISNTFVIIYGHMMIVIKPVCRCDENICEERNEIHD